MTIQEAVLKQVQFLRECQETRRRDAIRHADALNNFEEREAIASYELNEGLVKDSHGNELKLTNDIGRKGYIKTRSIELKKLLNSAKAELESSGAKVEVERSVLSAIKDLRGDAELDISHLGKYDI